MPRRCYASPAVWYSAFKTSSTTSDSTASDSARCDRALGGISGGGIRLAGDGTECDVHWSSAETGNHSVEELKASRYGGGGYWELWESWPRGY